MPELLLSFDGVKSQNIFELPYKMFVVYFYPKDDTPGCTIEAKDFTKLNEQFESLGVKVIGVSKDNFQSHCKFKEKYSINFDLVCDVEGKVCKQFGVLKEKSIFGRLGYGIERSSFVLDTSGKILKEWRGVKASDHADDVLKSVKVLLGL